MLYYCHVKCIRLDLSSKIHNGHHLIFAPSDKIGYIFYKFWLYPFIDLSISIRGQSISRVNLHGSLEDDDFGSDVQHVASTSAVLFCCHLLVNDAKYNVSLIYIAVFTMCNISKRTKIMIQWNLFYYLFIIFIKTYRNLFKHVRV